VLHYNGKAWSVAKTFGAPIGGASVAGKNDIWVFGAASFGRPALGAWHFNGHTWKLTGKGLQCGSALSATNAWAFSGTKVYHFNGSRWAGTNLKSLLPAKQLLNSPAVTGIIALSPGNVYAIGNGSLQDEGGPTVILHFNGAISVVSVSRIPGSAAQLASGATFKVAQPGVNQVAVILRYS
jgi:hypothetical protein